MRVTTEKRVRHVNVNGENMDKTPNTDFQLYLFTTDTSRLTDPGIL